MNSYVDAQCKHIITMVDVFENACLMAVSKDDGKISKDEEKILKKIKKATTRFKAELNNL